MASRVSFLRILWLTAAVALLSCGLAPHAPAQFGTPQTLSPDVTIPEVGQETLSQLQRAENFLAERQFNDAIDTLRRAADGADNELIPATGKLSPKGFTTYQPLAEELQRRLCTLATTAPEALQFYRSQVDAEAQTLFEEARQAHSEVRLRKIVANYLASSVGDEAALLAGDAALARGDVTAARRAWLKLHPALRTGDEAAGQLGIYPGLPWFFAVRGRTIEPKSEPLRSWLTSSANLSLLAAHPDPTVSLADIRARLVVASILEGNRPRAEWELQLFRQLHAGEQGRLAGRTGPYVDLLQQFFDQSRTWPAPKRSGEWSTFAGSPGRDHTAASDVSIAAAPSWTIDLPRIASDRELVGQGRLRVAEPSAGLLSYHPIVKDGLAIMADAQTMQAIELDSGKLAWEVLLREQPPSSPLTQQYVGVPRFTLTAAEGVILATLPAPVIPTRRAPTIRREDLSRMVGIDPETRKLVLDVVADDATMVFEGTPLVDRGRVYVCVRKQAELRPQAFVACYDLASGRLLWQQQVCSADSLGHGDHAEYATALLSLSHDTLYVNTNLGTVAALAVDNGAMRWLTKYPRAPFPATKPERSDRHFFRDLNPCLVHQGQVICAPADCDRIFSLDATSGQLIWTLPPGDAADAVHLLGVGEGYLIASGDYLYWINVLTGQIAAQFPPALPVGPGLALPTPRGWGRGILAGKNVYWPIESSLYVFAQSPEKSGMFYEPRRVAQIDLGTSDVSGGNVVIAEKHLLIATGDKLICFEDAESTPEERSTSEGR